ncbi:hypothetical protein [Actinokineospora sp.]|uniref:hypothetical protein n=1 Tax=Actinokineospora sp. TaxID=1872133 RepID=UPI003D6BFBE4
MSQLGAYKGIVRDAIGHVNSCDRPDPTVTFNRANLPRVGLDDVAALATGVMTSVPIWLNAGDLVTSLTFTSGGTAAGTPTNYWFALYSSAATPALMAQTADQLTAAWAADTVKTLALATAQRIVASGLYWAACMVTATTPPTLVGTIGAKPVLAGEGNLSQTSGAGLTTTAPATIATPAFKRQCPLVVAS